MKAIVVLDEEGQDAGQRAIKALYPEAYKMRDGVFLIKLHHEARMLSNDQINGIVFLLNGSYSGNWGDSLWDWLKGKKPEEKKETK